MNKSDKERITKLINDLKRLEKKRKLTKMGAKHLKELLKLDNIPKR